MRGSRQRASQVLTGSNWHEVMYSTMWATHPVACAFFLFYYVMLTYAKPSRCAECASKLCKGQARHVVGAIQIGGRPCHAATAC